MEEYIYPASLAVLALLAFIFNQNNNTKLALIMVLLGVYIIYSNETGYTATDFKNSMIDSIDKSAEEFVDTHGIQSGEEEIK
jgi:hypothetical protein